MNTVSHCFTLYATFLASNSVLGTSFSSDKRVFIQLWKKIILILYYHLINIVHFESEFLLQS